MKLLFLSMLSFVFIASTALALSQPDFIIVHEPKPVQAFSPLPTLGDTESFPVLSAQGVIAVDLDSSVVMYEKNADQPLLPASTTKIMTALVSLEYFPDDYVVTVKPSNIIGQKMGLTKGEKIKASDLLKGLLIYSANDAAEALAADYPGGREMFVNAMNMQASRYHLDHTHFVNPTGLDAENHVSTARDLVRLSQIAMQNPEFAKVVGTKTARVTSVDGEIVHYLSNINELLGEVDGVKGIKTGWTENARENLVTYIDRDDHKVIIALLGSQDRFGETKELINWIFTNYSWQEVHSP